MSVPTPTSSGIAPRHGDFASITDALDYAAGGANGLAFYSVRGELTEFLSYAALRADALALVAHLRGLGLLPGDTVAVIADTHPDFVRAFFACQYAGLIAVPLPMPLAFGGRANYVEHVRRLAEEAKVSVLLAPASLAEWLSPLRLRFVGTVSDLRGVQPAPGALPRMAPGDIAYLQFSSGSTRFPMGVAVKQGALMSNVAGILQHGLRVRPGDRAVSWLPLYHDMGLVGFLLSPLAGQIAVDLLSSQDFARRPLLWLSLLSANRGTISYSPSFGYELCMRRQRSGAATEFDLSSWRAAGIGGDMIRPEVLAAFGECFAPSGFRAEAFLPSYGMAEATLAISFAESGRGIETEQVDLDRLERDGTALPAPAAREQDGRSRTFVRCGRPLPGHAVEIRDTDGTVLPDRRVGRIFASGPSIMQGYHGRPAETAAALSPDGWLDTGDLGYLLDGALVITGRAKDLVIVNGRNVWPQDLEWSVEAAVPGVRTGDVAAFSVDDRDRNKEVLVLAIEARGGTEPAARAALAEAAAGIVRSRHGLETRVVFAPPGGLPRTSSGKLSRTAARQQFLAGKFAAIPVPA